MPWGITCAPGCRRLDIKIPDYGELTVDVPRAGAFYFAREDGIEVVRVLHGARYLDAALDA